MFLLSLSYLSYGMNGYGLPNGKLLGRILESASEITFLLLLILLAKGYTVTRARLRQMSTIKVTIFICAYVIMYMALFLCEKIYIDPGTVVDPYESSFGYGLVILRMDGWLIFIYATLFTLKNYPEKVISKSNSLKTIFLYLETVLHLLLLHLHPLVCWQPSRNHVV